MTKKVILLNHHLLTICLFSHFFQSSDGEESYCRLFVL